jgi:hypothetical protein
VGKVGESAPRSLFGVQVRRGEHDEENPASASQIEPATADD